MKARLIVTTIVVGGFALAIGGAMALAGKPADTALYPDLRTVVPAHLNLVNQQQQDILRFSNGIANTGAGPWAVRPDRPPAEATTVTAAMQEFRDSSALYKCGEQPKQVTECYNVVGEQLAGVYEYHPAHHHWHIGDIALFEVRQGSPTGPIVGGNSIKTTFCLIDWYRLDGNAPTSERTFFDCFAIQGIAPGWVDQYHPGDDRSAGVPHGRSGRERLLPRLDRELRAHLQRDGLHEQHSLGEVHADVGLEREPQGDGHRALTL